MTQKICRHLLVILLLVPALLFGAATGASAASPVLGQGSSFAFIAIDQWRADVARKLGLDLNYSSTGSPAGQLAFKNGQADFASSDIPFLPANIPSFQYAYLPIVAGGTAVMYNCSDDAGQPITTLKLSARLIARMFMEPGLMRANDPEIVAENPSLANRLPDKGLIRVARGTPAGTTAVFFTYLAQSAPDLWAKFKTSEEVFSNPSGEFITSYSDTFQTRLAVKEGWAFKGGSDLLADTVTAQGGQAKVNCFIGYAEAAYAVQKRLPVAYVKNTSGNYVLPTARAVAVALLSATRSPDGTQNLSRVADSPDPQAYPISSYNYLIVNTSAQSDRGKNDTIGQYTIYSITEGQRLSADLGYSPLPPNLVQQGLDAVGTVPGAPVPPPLGEWGKYYLQLGVQAAVGADRATAAAKKSAAAKAAAAAGGAGTAAGGTKNGTKKPGSTSAGTAGATAPDGTPIDPAAAAADGSGIAADGSVAPDGSASGQITNSSNQLQPDDPQLVAIAQPAPISRLPFGLAMLVLVFVPPAVLAFSRRKKATA